jgi:hypothetical protein
MTSFFIIKRPVEQDPLYFSEKFNRWHAWIDLIGLARFEPGTIYLNNFPVKLQRGDVARSIETLADRWKWNWRTVKKFLKGLQKEGRITFQSSPRTGTVIHIVNYDSYQRLEKIEKCRAENGDWATENIDDNEKSNENVQYPIQYQLQKNNNGKQEGTRSSGNKSKIPDEVRELHQLYCSRFEEKTSMKYHASSIKRELKDMCDLLKTYSYEQIQGIINAFFDTADHWIIERGYPWAALIKHASALAFKSAKKIGGIKKSDYEDAEAMERFFNKKRQVA